MGPSVPFPGELPDNVIKTRPQMMDNFSSKYAEALRNRATRVVLECLREKLLILIGGDDTVFAAFKKPFNLPIEIKDILVGPF
jgi:Iap family predicted aminopeptidase